MLQTLQVGIWNPCYYGLFASYSSSETALKPEVRMSKNKVNISEPNEPHGIFHHFQIGSVGSQDGLNLVPSSEPPPQ